MLYRRSDTTTVIRSYFPADTLIARQTLTTSITHDWLAWVGFPRNSPSIIIYFFLWQEHLEWWCHSPRLQWRVTMLRFDVQTFVVTFSQPNPAQPWLCDSLHSCAAVASVMYGSLSLNEISKRLDGRSQVCLQPKHGLSSCAISGRKPGQTLLHHTYHHVVGRAGALTGMV